MFCPNCGKEIKEDDLFCSECGWKKGTKVELEKGAKKSFNFKKALLIIIPIFVLISVISIIGFIIQKSRVKVIGSNNEWITINSNDYNGYNMVEGNMNLFWNDFFDIRYEYAGLPAVIDKNSDWGKSVGSNSAFAGMFANDIYNNYSPYFIYNIIFSLKNDCYLSENFSVEIGDNTYYASDLAGKNKSFEIKLRSDDMPKEKSYDAWYSATLPRNAERYKSQIQQMINENMASKVQKPLNVGKVTGYVYSKH